jgi:hypothetical protein
MGIPLMSSQRFILVQVRCAPTARRCCSDALAQNRQGKTRLSKWYVPLDDEEKVPPVRALLAER